MQHEKQIDPCQTVIQKLLRKKQKIQQAQSKPKRTLRSREADKHLNITKFNNPLVLPDNLALAQYLPNEIKSTILQSSKINVKMINQIKIAMPVDLCQGLRNMKKALKLFEQSVESIPQLDVEKVVVTRSTIQQQMMQPQEAYTLYLADRIDQLFQVGGSNALNASQGRNNGFGNLGIKGMEDFYGFGNDQIF